MASAQQDTVFNRKGIEKLTQEHILTPPFSTMVRCALPYSPTLFNHRQLPLRGASESVLCLGKGKAQEMIQREL